MLRMLEGSVAVAHAVKLCRPKVIAAYPITPQTHIVEELARLKAEGELEAEYITAESEFSAISIVAGASAYGVRVFTATASQGLLLMHEVLHAIAGLRLPVVMVVANRAVSAPINVWNDHQDQISQAFTGWISIFVASNQEAVDTVIQAYRIAEDRRVLLPVMIGMDGFFLTHVVEPVDMPSQEAVDAFLPEYEPEHAYLDPERPITIGCLATPDWYQEIRIPNWRDMLEAKEVIREVHDSFAKEFGRSYGDGLVESYKLEDADYVLVGMGSVMSTAKEVVDELRAEGKPVGLLRVRVFRPLPEKEILEALEGKKAVGVFGKDVAFGLRGPTLWHDVRACFFDSSEKPKLWGFIGGLGGRDVPESEIKYMFSRIMSDEEPGVEWVALRKDYREIKGVVKY